jgi:hypothetical protein
MSAQLGLSMGGLPEEEGSLFMQQHTDNSTKRDTLIGQKRSRLSTVHFSEPGRGSSGSGEGSIPRLRAQSIMSSSSVGDIFKSGPSELFAARRLSRRSTQQSKDGRRGSQDSLKEEVADFRKLVKSLSPAILLHPERSPFLRVWYAVFMIMRIWPAVVAPFVIGFLPLRWDRRHSWYYVAFSLMSDIFVALDIALGRFVMVFDVSESRWLWQTKAIQLTRRRSRYADWIACIPIDAASIFLPVGLPTYMAFPLQLLRFAPTVAKLRRSPATKPRTRNFWKYDKRVMTGSIIQVIWTIHMSACTWGMVGRCGRESGEPNWIDELGSTGFSVDATFKLFSAGLYWGTYTITGLGYGELPAKNEIEYLVGICLMLTSAFTWAVVVANFVAIITHMNQEDADHERSMDTLTDLLDECKAPRLLRKELRGYFETVRQADVGIKRAQDLCARLSPGLRIFAVDALHSYWLQKVFWLKNINMCPLHVDVAQAVISEFFAPKERLEWAREMLVIRRGVGIWNSAYAVGRGTVLGADMMVESDHLREPCRLFALTYLEILRMDFTTFNDIVALHPTIAKHVRAAVCWHIVRKGIIKYALKMALEEKDDESDEDLRTQRSGMIKRHLTSKKTAMLTVDDDKYIPLAETEHKHMHDESLIDMKKDIAEIHKMLSTMSPGHGHTSAGDRHAHHARTYERDEADAAAAESYLALRAGRVLTGA